MDAEKNTSSTPHPASVGAASIHPAAATSIDSDSDSDDESRRRARRKRKRERSEKGHRKHKHRKEKKRRRDDSSDDEEAESAQAKPASTPEVAMVPPTPVAPEIPATAATPATPAAPVAALAAVAASVHDPVPVPMDVSSTEPSASSTPISESSGSSSSSTTACRRNTTKSTSSSGSSRSSARRETVHLTVEKMEEIWKGPRPTEPYNPNPPPLEGERKTRCNISEIKGVKPEMHAELPLKPKGNKGKIIHLGTEFPFPITNEASIQDNMAYLQQCHVGIIQNSKGVMNKQSYFIHQGGKCWLLNGQLCLLIDTRFKVTSLLKAQNNTMYDYVLISRYHNRYPDGKSMIMDEIYFRHMRLKKHDVVNKQAENVSRKTPSLHRRHAPGGTAGAGSEASDGEDEGPAAPPAISAGAGGGDGSSSSSSNGRASVVAASADVEMLQTGQSLRPAAADGKDLTHAYTLLSWVEKCYQQVADKPDETRQLMQSLVDSANGMKPQLDALFAFQCKLLGQEAHVSPDAFERAIRPLMQVRTPDDFKRLFGYRAWYACVLVTAIREGAFQPMLVSRTQLEQAMFTR